MKKTLMALTAAGAMAAASSAFGQNGAQVFIDAAGCGILDANGDPGPMIMLPPDGDAISQGVITSSGNSKFTCSGTFPDPAPAKTTMFSDFLCSTPDGDSYDSHQVITKSGRVTITCHLKD